ncbi:hypothetical protein V1512DRAFT_169305 [Lipomyces arxii]|uniref:uncharacterized protein n=1 Tax=Lipomyces arxii TaxID=56418 RepID=UPI0034CE83F1
MDRTNNVGQGYSERMLAKARRRLHEVETKLRRAKQRRLGLAESSAPVEISAPVTGSFRNLMEERRQTAAVDAAEKPAPPTTTLRDDESSESSKVSQVELLRQIEDQLMLESPLEFGLAHEVAESSTAGMRKSASEPVGLAGLRRPGRPIAMEHVREDHAALRSDSVTADMVKLLDEVRDFRGQVTEIRSALGSISGGNSPLPGRRTRMSAASRFGDDQIRASVYSVGTDRSSFQRPRAAVLAYGAQPSSVYISRGESQPAAVVAFEEEEEDDEQQEKIEALHVRKRRPSEVSTNTLHSLSTVGHRRVSKPRGPRELSGSLSRIEQENDIGEPVRANATLSQQDEIAMKKESSGSGYETAQSSLSSAPEIPRKNSDRDRRRTADSTPRRRRERRSNSADGTRSRPRGGRPYRERVVSTPVAGLDDCAPASWDFEDATFNLDFNSKAGREFDEIINLGEEHKRMLEKFIETLGRISLEVSFDEKKREEGKRRMKNAILSLEGWI